ncbi:MAG: hypothetical protein GTO24_15445 [candidate division Zixibacteria bacterium]|nr:hypothetical protein [candidate division Zixibacteria bacterium]
MRIDLDLSIRKLIKVAEVKGSVDVRLIGEFLTKKFVKERLIDAIKEYGLVGTVQVDDDVISFADEK